MKKNLYLIGAGDLGREMEAWLELLPDFHLNWELRGYLDQNPNALNAYPSDYSIVGNPLSYDYKENDYVIICITNTLMKQNLIKNIRNRVKFFTYIAPNAILGKYIHFGEGVVICPNTCITTNVNVGDFVFINTGTQIGHDCQIGANCSIMANVDLGGHVTLGEGVYIGTKATIIPRITISDNITIGSGSVVIKDLKKAGTYFGNPAIYVI